MNARPIRLAQFTDTHLFAKPGEKLCGLDTSDSLARVIALARTDGWPPDAILATGDLSQDETPAAYERFAAIFGELGPAVHCLPGNHDVPATMAKAFGVSATVHVTRWADLGTWQVVLLNSAVPGDNGGRLDEAELDFLDRTLRNNPTRPALVTLHHNPVEVGSAWLDGMRLQNADAFFNIIDRYAHVRGVLWGHVHQEFESSRRDVRLMATPSTCLQFLPKSAAFALDPAPPGYRQIELYPDGRIESRVRRLASYPYTPDLSQRGY